MKTYFIPEAKEFNNWNPKLEAAVNEPELVTNAPNKEKETSDATTYSVSSQESLSTKMTEKDPKDAFLCNLPNAPPFILKMNKASSDPITSSVNPEAEENPVLFTSSMSATVTDESFDIEE